jgi:hypothetical protein
MNSFRPIAQLVRADALATALAATWGGFASWYIYGIVDEDNANKLGVMLNDKALPLTRKAFDAAGQGISLNTCLRAVASYMAAIVVRGRGDYEPRLKYAALLIATMIDYAEIEQQQQQQVQEQDQLQDPDQQQLLQEQEQDEAVSVWLMW